MKKWNPGPLWETRCETENAHGLLTFHWHQINSQACALRETLELSHLWHDNPLPNLPVPMSRLQAGLPLPETQLRSIVLFTTISAHFLAPMRQVQLQESPSPPLTLVGHICTNKTYCPATAILKQTGKGSSGAWQQYHHRHALPHNSTWNVNWKSCCHD